MHTDCDILNLCVRINLQTIFLRQGNDFFACFTFFQESCSACRLVTKNDIIKNSKAFHQFKMLVHHTDSQRVCVIGIVDLNLFAVFFDGSLFRLVKAKQHAHQGGFSCAVFTKQRVNFAVP